MRSLACIGVIVAACSQPSGEPSAKLTELRAEVAELRADSRDLRSELRSLRDEVRSLRTGEPVPASADEPDPVASSAGGGKAATAEAVPTSPAKPRAPAVASADAPPSQESVKISVESNPTGAKVYVGNKVVGLTPVLLERKPGSEELTLRIEKDGYRVRLMSVRPDEDTKLSVQLAKK